MNLLRILHMLTHGEHWFSGGDGTNSSISKSSITPNKMKEPAIHSKEMTFELSKAIKDCLSVSEQILCIKVEGLPLKTRDMRNLSKVGFPGPPTLPT